MVRLQHEGIMVESKILMDLSQIQKILGGKIHRGRAVIGDTYLNQRLKLIFYGAEEIVQKLRNYKKGANMRKSFILEKNYCLLKGIS